VATRRLASSIAAGQKPGTQIRAATVLDVIEPTTDEAGVVTGWQVLVDLGDGKISQAGVASTYRPIPFDIVATASYQNSLFVIDKVAGAQSGVEPGGRVAYGYVTTAGAYCTGTASAEVELSTELNVTFMARTGAAYELFLSTGYSSAGANTWALFRLRQTAFNSGLELGEWYRKAATIATNVHGFEGRLVVRNDTGIDFDVTIVPTLTSPTGIVASAFNTASTKAWVEVVVKGSSKLYQHAAPMTAPPDLS
jgi:hypothetical protein